MKAFFEFANDHPLAATFMVLFVCWSIAEVGTSIANRLGK